MLIRLRNAVVDGTWGDYLFTLDPDNLKEIKCRDHETTDPKYGYYQGTSTDANDESEVLPFMLFCLDIKLKNDENIFVPFISILDRDLAIDTIEMAIMNTQNPVASVFYTKD